MSKVTFVCLLIVHYALVISSLRLEWMVDLVYIEKAWNNSHSSIICRRHRILAHSFCCGFCSFAAFLLIVETPQNS
jgi:membrane-bound metal-dependent hydrolase YbcI (DUF457 family)